MIGTVIKVMWEGTDKPPICHLGMRTREGDTQWVWIEKRGIRENWGDFQQSHLSLFQYEAVSTRFL